MEVNMSIIFYPGEIDLKNREIKINYEMLEKFGLLDKLDFRDIVILDFLYDVIVLNCGAGCPFTDVDDKFYFHITHKKILENNPIIGKGSNLGKRLFKLKELGLIDIVKDDIGRYFYYITPKGISIIETVNPKTN
jgi:hypothetical protein